MKFQHKLAQEQRTNRPDRVEPGEVTFLRYAILQAVHDAARVRKSGPTWIALNARDWFDSADGIDVVGSFAWVCHWLQCDADTTRTRCYAEVDRLIQENADRSEPTTLPVEERITSDVRALVFGQGNLFSHPHEEAFA